MEIKFNPNTQENLSKIIKKNIILYTLGRAVSVIGSKVFSFAMSLYILNLTGSGIAFSISLFTSMLPNAILSPFAGVIADKVDRKRMVVITDILSGILMFVLMGIAYFDSLRIIYIYITIFLLSCIGVFFGVSMKASKANIVDKANMKKINSYGMMINSISKISGSIFGGLIYAFMDIKVFIVLNGISFILSGISELFIDFNVRGVVKRENKNKTSKVKKSIFAQIAEGFRYIRKMKLIYILTMYGMLLDFIMICGVSVCIPFIINNVLELGSIEYGIINACFPIGIMIGAALLSRNKKVEEHIHKKLIFNMMGIALGVCLIGWFSSSFIHIDNKLVYVVIFCVYALISSYLTVTMDIPIQIIFQEQIPNEIRGRVMGLQRSLSYIVAPVGIILSGILIDIVPPYIILLVSGIILMVTTIIFGMNKELRKY